MSNSLKGSPGGDTSNPPETSLGENASNSVKFEIVDGLLRLVIDGQSFLVLSYRQIGLPCEIAHIPILNKGLKGQILDLKGQILDVVYKLPSGEILQGYILK